MTLLIGAVADDFTGATDLANTLVHAGLKTVQLIGVPENGVDLQGAEAVVIALKSRSAPVQQAVDESIEATDWLRRRGARKVLSKYCSTFDSTAEGNIGPIADAMMARLAADFALVCPAFPGAGRTIYKGQLFVLDKLLAESPMKDHPLTPMRDSDLMRLMEAQSRHSVGLIDLATVRQGPDAIHARIEVLKSEGHRYGVIDVIENEDLMIIGKVAQQHLLVTGGSGIAAGLPAAWRGAGVAGSATDPALPPSKGRALILAGSCSTATRAQIAAIPETWRTWQVSVEDLVSSPDLADRICAELAAASDDAPCLVYSSAAPEDVTKVQAQYGGAAAGEMLEALMGQIAVKMTAQGVGRLIVAGGETSGAVVSALGVHAMRIGPQIAPGVPWCETLDDPKLALALKSGNFGGPSFFQDALEMLG